MLKQVSGKTKAKKARTDDPMEESPVDILRLAAETARLALNTAFECRVVRGFVSTSFKTNSKTQWQTPRDLLAPMAFCGGLDVNQTAAQGWAAVCASILRQDVISADERALLTAHMGSITDPAQLVGLVSECQAWSGHDGTSCMAFVVKPELNPILSIIVRLARHTGTEVRFGPAPPKQQEREVQSLLRKADRALARNN